jgi:hypothetical protein
MAGPGLFALGSLAGGAILGLIAACVGAIFEGVTVLVSVIALLYVLHRFGVQRLRPPSSGWQVPREWRLAGRRRYSFAFGLFLGGGVATIVSSWGIYLVFVGAAAQLSVLHSIAVGAVFGAARCLPLLLFALRGLYRPETLRGVSTREVVATSTFVGAHTRMLELWAVSFILSASLEAWQRLL